MTTAVEALQQAIGAASVLTRIPSQAMRIAIEMESTMAALRSCGWGIDQADEAVRQALRDECDYVRVRPEQFSVSRFRDRLDAYKLRAAQGEVETA